jgi:hypothetical protein
LADKPEIIGWSICDFLEPAKRRFIETVTWEGGHQCDMIDSSIKKGNKENFSVTINYSFKTSSVKPACHAGQ